MIRGEDFSDLFHKSPEGFTEELVKDLKYYQKTKIVTYLDLYRIRKRLLPMLDVWISSRYDDDLPILNIHEDLLLQALRTETSLSDLREMINENKYIFRNIMKLYLMSLPEDI